MINNQISYTQAQKQCRSIDFSNPINKFESYSADFPGIQGSMISFPLQFFEAILPYLIDKAQVKPFFHLILIEQTHYFAQIKPITTRSKSDSQRGYQNSFARVV